jgi:hypothetical protein
MMKQNPELMKMFSSAMAQSMSQQNPAFSFASGIANKEPQVNTMFVHLQLKPTQRRNPGCTVDDLYQHPATAPDLTAGRGEMFRESGVDLNNNNDYNNSNRIPVSRVRPDMKDRRPIYPTLFLG